VRLRADRQPGGGAGTFIFDATGTSDIDDPMENITFRWEFGDGSSAGGMNVSHSYKAPGSYVATLTVEDGSGGRVTRTVTVNVPSGTAQAPGWPMPVVLAAVAAAMAAAFVVGALLMRQARAGRPGAPNGKNGRRPGSRPPRTAPQSINNDKGTSNNGSK
jgi:PKD repeat protein